MNGMAVSRCKKWPPSQGIGTPPPMRLFFHMSGRWQPVAGDTLRLILVHDIVGDVVDSHEGYPPYRVTEHIDADSVELSGAMTSDGRWLYSCPVGTTQHLALAEERRAPSNYVNEDEFDRLVSVADSLQRLRHGGSDSSRR